jgi:DinB superfamily
MSSKSLCNNIKTFIFQHYAFSQCSSFFIPYLLHSHMATHLQSLIWGQFGAAIDTLDKAIDACPEHIWNDRTRFPEYWYVAYHTLFFLDYYLSDAKSEKDFVPPPPYTLSELDPAGVLPDRIYTQAELSTYLTHCREKCRLKIAGLTDEKMAEPCGFEYRNFSVAELMLYNMRHVQHHSAQMNLILRQTIDSAPTWVGQTKIPLEGE